MNLSLSLMAQQRLVAIWTYSPCLFFGYLACPAILTGKPFGYAFAVLFLLIAGTFFAIFRALIKKVGPIPASEKHSKALLVGVALIVSTGLIAGLIVQLALGRLPSSYPQLLLMAIGFFPMLGGLMIRCVETDA